MKTVSVDRLREVVEYDPKTGLFKWIHPELKWLHGKPVGRVSDGYLRFAVDGISVRAHRAAWALAYGEYPTNPIDHINGNRLDNRLENLRQATPRQNSYNKKLSCRSKTGVKGVGFDKRISLWNARIVVNGKRIYLGLFKTIDDAAKAYAVAAQLYHGEFACSSRS
jgi:hypothetical protein